MISFVNNSGYREQYHLPDWHTSQDKAIALEKGATLNIDRLALFQFLFRVVAEGQQQVMLRLILFELRPAFFKKFQRIVLEGHLHHSRLCHHALHVKHANVKPDRIKRHSISGAPPPLPAHAAPSFPGAPRPAAFASGRDR